MVINETMSENNTQTLKEDLKLQRIQKKEEMQKLEGEKAPKEEKKPEEQQKLKENFPIVGIGASAGGLGAFEAFFSGIPADVSPGVAFVIIQHLDPQHKSILSTLIGRYTDMPVYEISDGMEVKPNCVYVIPPNRDLIYSKGSLHLLEPTESHGPRKPIDFFFSSLAKEKKERAIGIVLSGSGSDGTVGIRAIKAEGGMVMTQTPESCEYDSMPCNVIDTDLADFVLPPEEMPAQIVSFVIQLFWGKVNSDASTEDSLNRILNIIFTQTGHDFSHYKKYNIIRRIKLRMAAHFNKNIDEYVNYLEQKPTEVEALFHYFLISVTSFFRDPEAFNALKEKIIPKIFAGKLEGEAIRIWVPSCSTGEEAYSIAILLQEHMDFIRRSFKIQIFANDIDSRAIEQARSGIYPSSIAKDVSSERLERFFTLGSDGNYRIRKNIREMVIFSEHDLIRDPPISRLDLLSCRNVLIYMDGELQKRLIPLFNYALIPGKYLFLGSSETINRFTNLFDTLDHMAKLYQSKSNVGIDHLHSIETFIQPKVKLKEIQKNPFKNPAQVKSMFRELTEKTLLRKKAPAGILVNEKGEILYIHGRPGIYLEPATGGSGTDNILKKAHKGLQQKLTIALHRAVTDRKPVFQPAIQVKTNGDFTNVNLEIIPVSAVPQSADEQYLFLIIFEETRWEQKIIKEQSSRVENELAPGSVKEFDQPVLELLKELQTKEEELNSSYEKMQSINEDLQLTNEELEISKQELQSVNEEMQTVNEELATVNAELQSTIADLSQANNDMNNLLFGSDIGTVFVDHDMKIMGFTPAVKKVVNLIPTDMGRPISDINFNLLEYSCLAEDIREVLDKHTTKEIDVQSMNGSWYLVRFQPYRTLENVIKGAVVTFTDITWRKKVEKALKESEQRFKALSEATPIGAGMSSIDGVLRYANPAFERILGYGPGELLGKKVYDVWWNAEDRDAWANIIKKNGVVRDFQAKLKKKDGTAIWGSMGGAPIVFGSEPGVMGTIQDITERKKAEEALRQGEEKYRLLTSSIDQGYFIIDILFDENNHPIDMYYVEANAAATRMLGQDFTGKHLRKISPVYEEYWYEIFGNVALTGQSVRLERYSDPDKKWYSFYIFKIGSPDSRRIGNLFMDITERKRTEEALKESEELYRKLFESTDDGFVLVEPIFDERGTSDDYRMLKVNEAWERQTGLQAADFVGKRIRESMPEVEHVWPATFAEVARTGTAQHFESYNAVSGQWFDLHVFPYRKGQVGVMFRDITERKRAEEALKESEFRYRTLFDSIDEGFCIIEMIFNENGKPIDYRFLETNQSFEKQTGLIDAFGKRMRELAPKHEEHWFEIYGRIAMTGEPVRFQNPAEQLHRYYDVYAFRFGQPEKKQVAILFNDITRNKLAEEALKNVNEILEDKVKERTEELEKAYKVLQEIDIVRKQEIHHRIKNNLQVISSLLDLQAEKFRGKKNIEDSQVLESFKESKDRVISMALIHEELHKGGKLDTLNFSHYIEGLADNLLLTYKVGNNGIILDKDIEEDIFFDMDTSVPLGIIINELVSNSLKHAFPCSDKGEMRIKLHREENRECEIEDSKSTTFTLSVADNGVGIPEDFDIEDLDSLGLQLVTTLVDQLDGEFELKKNKGTEFTIRFTVPENNNLKLAKHTLQLTDND